VRIRSLHIKNVKSFGEDVPEFTFSDGTIFLTGQNGAGKSTMIEAIGYALFNVQPYKLEDMVRNGAGTGVITAWIEKGDDSYRVVRKFGKSPSWVVYDEDGVDVGTKKADVTKFLCGFFEIDDEKQLEKVFEKVIGVPQGMFTTVFKLKPAERKAIFDPIINVEKFRRASGTHAAVKNQFLPAAIEDCKHRIEIAEEYLRDHAEDPAKLESLTRSIAALGSRIDALEKEEAGLRTKDEAFEAKKTQSATLEQKIATATANLARFEEALEKAKIERTKSVEAREACEGARAGHEAHEHSVKELVAFEKERAKRDEIRERRAVAENQRASLTSSIKGLEDQLGVDRESELEQVEKLRGLQEATKASGASGEARTKSAEEAHSNHERAREALEAVRAARDDLAKRLYKADDLVAQSQAHRNAIAELEAELEALSDVESLAETVPAAEEAETRIRLQVSELESTIKGHRKSQADLSEQICPFIGETCDRVRPEVFEELIKPLQGEVDVQVEALAEAVKGRETAQEAKVQLAGLREKQEQASRARAAMEGATEQATLAFVGWAAAGFELPSNPEDDAVALSLDPFRTLASEMDAAVLAHEQAEEVARDQDKAAGELASRARADAEAANRRAEEGEKELAKLRKSLEGKNDALVEQGEKKLVLDAKLREIDGQLEPFGELDEKIESGQGRRDASRADHDIFQANKNAASEVDARKQAVEELEAKLVAETEARESSEGELRALLADFDPVEADLVRKALGEARTTRATLTAERKKDQQRLEELTEIVEEMEQRKQTVLAVQGEKAKMERFAVVVDDLWSILRSVGPKVARRLLGAISLRANQIFGALHDEPATLIWEEGYEVKLKNARGEIPFKGLSGGEQMSAALSIQMAMARDFANSAFCIFDEPTVHLDARRCEKLGRALQEAREAAGFTQVFLVSHDDTFGPYVDQEIKLAKDKTRGTQRLD
jgi:exonuclease SbcC